jgi:hypothetical protein
MAIHDANTRELLLDRPYARNHRTATMKSNGHRASDQARREELQRARSWATSACPRTHECRVRAEQHQPPGEAAVREAGDDGGGEGGGLHWDPRNAVGRPGVRRFSGNAIAWVLHNEGHRPRWAQCWGAAAVAKIRRLDEFRCLVSVGASTADIDDVLASAPRVRGEGWWGAAAGPRPRPYVRSQR